MTEEGNPKLNPWLPAAATHVSSGSNDSCYLLKKKKYLAFFHVIIDDEGALLICRHPLSNAITASSIAESCHAA